MQKQNRLQVQQQGSILWQGQTYSVDQSNLISAIENIFDTAPPQNNLLTLELAGDFSADEWENLRDRQGLIARKPGLCLMRRAATTAELILPFEGTRPRLLLTQADETLSNWARQIGLFDLIVDPNPTKMSLYSHFRDARRERRPIHIWHHCGAIEDDALQLADGVYPLADLKADSIGLVILQHSNLPVTSLTTLNPPLGVTIPATDTTTLETFYMDLLTYGVIEAVGELQSFAALSGVFIPAFYSQYDQPQEFFIVREAPPAEQAGIPTAGGIRLGNIRAGRNVNFRAQDLASLNLEAGNIDAEQDVTFEETSGTATKPDAPPPPPLDADPIEPDTIFISYSRRDYADYVEPLVKDLRAAGLKVWLDQSRIGGGDNWQDQLDHALKHCGKLVFCISPDALASQYCKFEYRYFFNNRKPLFPVICREAELPPLLHGIQYLPYEDRATLINRLKA